jgi:aminopeptidase N
MANKANTQLERSSLFRLLGNARDPKLARAALDFALTDEPGQTDSSALVSAVAKEHPDLAIDFTLANADKVEALVDSSGRPRYVARMATESRDPAMIGKLRSYAEKRLPPSSRASIEQTINLLEARTRLEPAIRAGVKAWLG